MKNKQNHKQQKIHNSIAFLKEKKAQQLLEVKQQFATTARNLKPSTVIKKTIMDLYEEPKLKTTVLNSTLSLITGMLSRKLVIGKSNSLVKSILGYFVQFATTKIVSNKI